ncbi:MAG TPA: lecithin retinol acyltransferase family protein [Bacilli bacterium]|nr:lecithin retinol acyltransferase family protein [Bacilli bacterium]HQQ39779.1 lecithin retinol acyltransferase family protein [Bacilli bacterium]
MEKWQLIDPYPGSHIRTKMGEIYHHGIYIGNDEVVQFGMPSEMMQDHKKIKVLRSNMKDFLVGFLEVRVYTKKELKEKRSDEEIVRIALLRVGEGNYNLLKNNCEHFAYECTFGVKKSDQVDSLIKDIQEALSK